MHIRNHRARGGDTASAFITQPSRRGRPALIKGGLREPAVCLGDNPPPRTGRAATAVLYKSLHERKPLYETSLSVCALLGPRQMELSQGAGTGRPATTQSPEPN